MNNLEKMFIDLLEKTLANKKGMFNSRFIYKRLKIKNNDLMNIMSLWMDKLIDDNLLELVHTGKDKNDDILYMTKDFFEEVVKNRLPKLDFLLDENTTYTFLCDLTASENPNMTMLVNKIEQMTYPLVKFDKGSRDAPIMLNLFKIFVPERLIAISDKMIEDTSSAPPTVSESKKVKKMIFKDAQSVDKEYTAHEIILTALSYILMEKGKLLLTKKEIADSRGFKVFFNSPDFSVFSQLIQRIYPFNPVVDVNYISFYPENWLDIKQIKKQVSKEDPSSFLERNFPFLDKNEISTLCTLMDLEEPSKVDKNIKEKKEKEIIKKEEEEDINPVNDIKLNTDKKNKETFKPENLKRKKPKKSEPLKFLNEIIYKEKENKNLTVTENKTNQQHEESENRTNDLIETVDQFDTKERYYLMCILDSTKVEAGYYSHSVQDENFQKFVEKLNKSNYFDITKENEKYVIKRKIVHANNQYDFLREKLEEKIMISAKEVNHMGNQTNQKTNQTEGKKTIQEEENLTDPYPEPDFQQKDDSLLENLLLEDTPDESNEDDAETLIIEKSKESIDDTQEELKLDEIDHESFFDISNEHEEPGDKLEKKSEEQDLKPEAKDSENNIATRSKKEQENDETDRQNKELKEELQGNIISVLTEDQEKWLKIKLLSEQIGFELRDGLAYKPDIAVFDDGFTHLEPIARNSGAAIMKIDEFMKRLGFRDKH